MPMQCEHCHKQLMKFQTIMETLPEIRIVVVAPHDENPRLIERYREEFSRVAVGLESLNERIWNTLSGAAHDHFIYDRCGRLANIIRHPKSDMSKFEHTLWALKLAISYAQCGWCQYDPPHLPVPQKPIVTACASFTHNGNTKMPQFERKIDEQRKLEEQKRVNELYTGLNGEEREHRLDRNGENNLRQLKTPLQQNIQDSAMTTRMTTFFNPAARTSSLYDVGDEEGDYDYSHAASETTVTPNEGTQIRGTKRPKDLPFLFENQVPCAAFTDEICMEQKKRIGADRMSKCCDKGIYLTDLCVPGRCTNATIELCCMQKFLQSKYKCCFNDSEAINSPGDAFSRCCFHRFVQNDDKCCPARRAKFHWLTAHEICLPNVRIDLSNLRFSVHVPKNVNNNNSNQEVNNTITIDLNVDKSWDHSCEQGTKVLQFPYLPDDEFSDWKEIYENSEESR